MTDKVRENKARRKAARQGFTLLKSRRRDVDAPDYNGFMLIDAERNAVVFGADPMAYSASIEEIEEWLTRTPRIVPSTV